MNTKSTYSWGQIGGVKPYQNRRHHLFLAWVNLLLATKESNWNPPLSISTLPSLFFSYLTILAFWLKVRLLVLLNFSPNPRIPRFSQLYFSGYQVSEPPWGFWWENHLGYWPWKALSSQSLLPLGSVYYGWNRQSKRNSVMDCTCFSGFAQVIL